jgi:hypothetical protein
MVCGDAPVPPDRPDEQRGEEAYLSGQSLDHHATWRLSDCASPEASIQRMDLPTSDAACASKLSQEE